MRERFCCCRRASRLAWDVERETAIVSRPEISSRSVCRSVASALPRMEPMVRWKKDSVGASEILRSRARRRERLAESISWVASRPAALRAMVASVTGLGREKKFCQGEETEAKPESRDMTDIPMTPMRSREASLKLCEVSEVGLWPTICRSHCPLHQKPRSHAVNPATCNIHASLSLPLPFPVNS